jgi:transcriptional regulator with XRE-family HTH domain
LDFCLGKKREFNLVKKRKSSGRMASKGFPNPVDVHVGARMRLRRTLLGLTQMGLAERMGITFQQVQKYERGTNRVSSSRLYDLARILDVPIAYFFGEMGSDVMKQSPSALAGQKPREVDVEKDPAIKRETLELVRCYYRIPDERVRQRLTNMIRAIAAAD